MHLRNHLRLALLIGLLPTPTRAAPLDLTDAPIHDRDPIVLTPDLGEEPGRFGPVEPTTIAALRGYVRARRSAIHRCLDWHLDDAWRKNPPVPLSMHIDAGGRVVADAFTGHAQSETCIARALAAHRFAARPGRGSIAWRGVLELGVDAPAVEPIRGMSIEVSDQTAALDASMAAGRAPRLPTPARPVRDIAPAPGWVDEGSAIDTITDLGDCAAQIPPHVDAGGARIVVRIRPGETPAVDIDTDLGPAVEACLRSGYPKSPVTAEPGIVALTLGYIRPPPREGPRIIRGTPMVCCSGNYQLYRAWLAPQIRAVEACYRARLVQHPELEGSLPLRLVLRGEAGEGDVGEHGSVGFHVALSPDRASPDQTMIDDPSLIGCTAAAIERIRLPSYLLRGAPRQLGRHFSFSVHFERVERQRQSRWPWKRSYSPRLDAWLIVQDPELDRAELLQRTRASVEGASNEPAIRVAAARVASDFGRPELARALLDEALELARASGDLDGQLAAWLVRIELSRREGDPRYRARGRALHRAVEVDARRSDVAVDDPLARRLDKELAVAIMNLGVWRYSSSDPHSPTGLLVELTRLWTRRTDTGARRMPSSDAYTGDDRMLMNLAWFEGERGDWHRALALLDRHRQLFPAPVDPELLARLRRDQTRWLVDATYSCRWSAAPPAHEPAAAARPPCPEWLDALAVEVLGSPDEPAAP